MSKEPAGAEVDAEAELVGEALGVSDGDSVGDALALGEELVGVALVDGVVLEAPPPQAVRASRTPAAVVVAIDRRAPRVPFTVPVSSRRGPRHHRRVRDGAGS